MPIFTCQGSMYFYNVPSKGREIVCEAKLNSVMPLLRANIDSLNIKSFDELIACSKKYK